MTNQFVPKTREEEVREILALATSVQTHVPGAHDAAATAISNGTSIADFRAQMLGAIPAAQPIRQPSCDIPHKDFKRYSVSRLLKCLSSGSGRVDGLEGEVSDELSRATNMPARGAWLPWAACLPDQQRDNLFVTGAIGGMISPTNLLSSQYIDALRNRAMVIQMGARVLPGLQGTILIPRLNTPSAITVKTEGVAYATSTPTFGQVTLSPKIAPALVRFSKLLAVQSNPAIESLVRDDLIKQINLKIDEWALNGAGSGGEPTGIKNTTGVNTWTTIAAGRAPTWANVIDMETQIAIDNADVGQLGYMVNPAMRGVLKTLDKGTDTGQFVMTQDPLTQAGLGVINGYRAGVTNQVLKGLTSGTQTTVCSQAFFGNWEDLLIGMWGGGIDLVTDQISTPGWVAVHGQAFVDVGVRNPVSLFYTDQFVSGTSFA
jgi:HK97 family phage major capsid protein